VDRAQAGEQRRPAGTRRAAGEDGFGQFPAAGKLPGAEVVGGGAQRPVLPPAGVRGWREPHRLLFEDGRRPRVAIQRGPLRRRVQHGGDLFARPVRAQCQVPGALCRLSRVRRQLTVHVPAFTARHPGIQHGLEQGMGEPQRIAVALDEALVDGLVQRRPRILAAVRGQDHVLARVGGGGDQPADPQRIPGQLAQPGPHQIAQDIGDGQGLARRPAASPLQ